MKWVAIQKNGSERAVLVRRRRRNKEGNYDRMDKR
jgi:hypothetical protein